MIENRLFKDPNRVKKLNLSHLNKAKVKYNFSNYKRQAPTKSENHLFLYLETFIIFVASNKNISYEIF